MNGFTLIELLAVIVILVIIALIATPIVINIIEDTKMNSIKISADNYVKTLELTLMSKNKYPKTEEKEICEIIIKNDKSYINCNYLDEPLLIDVNGEKPQGGIIEHQNHEIIEYEIDIDEKTIYSNEPTPSECFEITENEDGTLTITKYLCGSSSNTPMLDVIIPKRINKAQVSKIGSNAFERSKITSVIIPLTVKTIGFAAFRYNNLKTVVIPDSVESIGVSSFQN